MEVRKDFKKPIEFLNILKKNCDPTPIKLFCNILQNYSSEYLQEHAELDEIMDNKMDRDIAFDAYHLMKEKEFNEIVLSSLDGDFVDEGFKPKIERALDGLKIFNILSYT